MLKLAHAIIYRVFKVKSANVISVELNKTSQIFILI